MSLLQRITSLFTSDWTTVEEMHVFYVRDETGDGCVVTFHEAKIRENGKLVSHDSSLVGKKAAMSSN